jgi:hypothetical protein
VEPSSLCLAEATLTSVQVTLIDTDVLHQILRYIRVCAVLTSCKCSPITDLLYPLTLYQMKIEPLLPMSRVTVVPCRPSAVLSPPRVDQQPAACSPRLVQSPPALPVQPALVLIFARTRFVQCALGLLLCGSTRMERRRPWGTLSRTAWSASEEGPRRRYIHVTGTISAAGYECCGAAMTLFRH